MVLMSHLAIPRCNQLLYQALLGGAGAQIFYISLSLSFAFYLVRHRYFCFTPQQGV